MLVAAPFCAALGNATLAWAAPFASQDNLAARTPPPVDPPCFDNENRFVDCGNGTVTDAVTGLVWLKDAGCLGTTDWAAGSLHAAELADGTCGLGDGSAAGTWRLATLDEWRRTIAVATRMGCSLEGPLEPPALTNDAGTSCMADGPSSFTNVTSSGYWTSTTHEQHPNNAWVVSLSGTIDGFVYPAVKNFALPVWPVRD
ncbi:MAG: DUF1566 domain-containing protein [Vicinamibacterales bacterium]